MHRSWKRGDWFKLVFLLRRHEHPHRVRRLISEARDRRVYGCERVALADRGAEVEAAGGGEPDHSLDLVAGIGERPSCLELLRDEALRQRPRERLDTDAEED